MEAENKKVRFDESKNHVWIDSKQFISLERFIELKNDTLVELKLLQEEVSRLRGENEAYKVLLKDKLKLD